MSYFTSYMSYLAVIVIAAVISLVKYRQLDKASKIFSIMLIMTLISEVMAYVIAKYYRNNFPVYHFFAPIQLFLVGLYFNYSIESFRRKRIGIYIGIIGLLFGVFNTLFLQPIKTFNSYFLLFEGLCTIFMCLYAFNKMFVNEDIDILKSHHFWFTFILLTFWSITYVNWGVREFIRYKMLEMIFSVGNVLWVVNVLTYSGIAFVFLFYRKNIVQRE